MIGMLLAASLLAQPTPAPKVNHKIFDGKFFTLAAASTILTVVDLELTYHRRNKNDQIPIEQHKRGTFSEGNPFAKPFILDWKMGTYAIYAATNVIALAVAAKMRQKGKYWWEFLPVMTITAHTIGITLTLTLPPGRIKPREE